MKKLLILLIALIGCTSVICAKDVIYSDGSNNYGASAEAFSSWDQELETDRNMAKSGYRGFAELNSGYYISGVAAFEISTTHGYQINHYLFVGGGIGVDLLFTDGLESGGVAIPLYAALKGNLGSSIAQFTYGSRLGLSVIPDGSIPFLWNINAGLRLGFTPNFALNITPDFSLLVGSEFFDARIGLRIGFEF